MVKRTNTESILGVVLAGGKSSRMGTDKALLPFMGATLLDYQFDKLVTLLGEKNAVVSGNYPHLPNLLDQKIGLGPLGGIISITNNYPDYDHFLFLPVDMPNISTGALIKLIDFANQDSFANCWSFKSFPMPLIIKNDHKLQAILSILPKDLSIHFLTQQLNLRALEIGELNKIEFLNTNTIKEWQEVNL